MEDRDCSILQLLDLQCDAYFARIRPFISVLKDKDMANKYRQTGNVHFAKKTTPDFLNALKCYNQSICFAENDSEELSIGYSNRSAVYMELKLYETCLENIEMARSVAGYPARLTEKLSLRETKCKEMLAAMNAGGKTEKSLEPKLSYPPHQTVPFIANCLELRENEQYGRHVVTNKDLKVGDIIAIEEPFCSMNPLERQYELCENCHRENDQSLIPCKGCTFVMFCGEQCREEATQRFHKYECPIIDFMHEVPNIRRENLFSLRMTLCALTSFQSPNDLCSFVEAGHHENVFSVNYAEMNGNYKSYAPIDGMLKKAKPTSDDEQNIKILRYTFDVMMTKTELRGSFSTRLYERLIELNEKHELVSEINAAEIPLLNFNDSEFIRNIVPFRSLLSHSCIPNICPTYHGNKTIISVLKPIKAGEQIFDQYGGLTPLTHTRDERWNIGFQCQCVACEKNFGPGRHHRTGLPVIPPVNIDQNNKFDRNVATANLQQITKYLQKYCDHNPSVELLNATELYYETMQIVYAREIPLNLRLK